MSQRSQLTRSAGTGSRSTSSGRGGASPPGGPSSSSPRSSGAGPHGRVRAKLMRVHALLYADNGALLSPISRSALERALSAFLSDAVLSGAPPGPRGASSYVLQTSSGRGSGPERARENKRKRDIKFMQSLHS